MAGAESAAAGIVADVRARLAEDPQRTVPALRAVRREVTRLHRHQEPSTILAAVRSLLETPGVPRWLAYELLHSHGPAMKRLTLGNLELLGRGMCAWDEVDTFACYLSGPAWREGQVATGDIQAWAASADRWWRRAALVSTVPLNCTARGGKGDAARTLALCDRLVDDRDDMVVKAMSWALRELATKEPARVERYLLENRERLAPRVLREVRNKLLTGRKNPAGRGRFVQARPESTD